MKSILCIAVLAASLLLTPQAHAEGNCPPGYFPQSGPGWQGCAPGPDINNRPQAVQEREVNPNKALYGDFGDKYGTWGAVATSPLPEGRGTDASSTGALYESDAKKAAVKACKTQGGGRKCEVKFTYWDGCMAVILYDKDGGGWRAFSQGADKEKAAKEGVKHCTEDGGLNCRATYSECTAPVWR
jgi:hypothetical protein